ncbi:MAG: methionine--tRNA ligase [Candidatus Nitrosocaldus sp.]|nr:methionine--tRNA ligase [Candidatus Nitrosocaldus sp.]MDW8275146.1 methionine--tRNA ligase [Candidatus Nitrosocaldus sp.]
MDTSERDGGDASGRGVGGRGRIIITSALPYANGEIHLGHVASTYLPADILTRYYRLKGYEAYHVCASDDFGTPILIKAEQEGKTPEEYVRYWHDRDEQDFRAFGISFDIFHSTSSRENVEFVQDFFMSLYRKGYIYEREVVQYYCPYDGKFLPDRYVIGRCPYCNADNQYSDSCESCGRVPEQILEPRCAICRREPVKRASRHYFFRLSAFSDRLKEWLSTNTNLQQDVRNYVLRWIEQGLQDWDITRDIRWGVRIPVDEEGKVLYGWFDNHLCYISTALLLARMNGLIGDGGKSRDGRSRGGDGDNDGNGVGNGDGSMDDTCKFWNSSVIYHFIGKDIVYHHYLFLPAMRLGDGRYKLPDHIPTRGHLMLQGQKISKSRNWYISLREFMSAFDPDYLRFYLALITPYSQEDLNFDWDEFASRVNAELIDNVGNFINRALNFASRYGIVGGGSSSSGAVEHYDDRDRESIREIERIAGEVGALIESNELDRGLRRILAFSSYFNQYFQSKEPWSRIKSASGDERSSAYNCIYISVNAVASLAILLEPYIPFSAERIWMQLNMQGSVHEQRWENASRLMIGAGHRVGSIKPLFRKIGREEVEAQKGRLGRQIAG